MEAKTFKLFQSARNSCETIGIYVMNHKNHSLSIHSKILLIYLSMALLFVSSTANIFYMAKSVLEYNDSFLLSIASFLNMTVLSISILKMPTILMVIKQLEETIKKSM